MTGIYVTDSNGTAIKTVNNNTVSTFTISESKAVKIMCYKSGATDMGQHQYQLESGSTATAWEPYANICPISGLTGLSVYVSPTQDQQDATTYAVDWTSEAGTVYGGTLDVVTGLLTVDKAMVDMGTLSWRGWIDSVEYIFYAPVSNRLPTRVDQAVSSQYTWNPNIYTWRDLANGQMTGENGRTHVYVRDTLFSSIADFQTAMSGVQLCYELATPITYQLTAQEVQMLLGENYVWSSSGDTVSVTYYDEGDANTLQSLNILLGGRYSNPKTADDVSDKEALEIILGGNK